MHGTRIEKEVEICATNLANKTKCMSTNAKKCGKNLRRHLLFTISEICGVKAEHSRLKSYGNP
jgi:hypothetical protein